MSSRSRIVAFGSAVAVAVIGGICAAVFPGLTGQLLALVLISVGLGAVVLLVFYEVGLSEDKARAAEQEHQEERATRSTEAHPRPRLRPRNPRRLRE
ncbi:MAG TPA: hypothetical protein VFI54_13355 [Solirubrobacteraceae bacterium]|nr:hypothetical protein [Solirubrobacteraceae bacterium]